MARSSRDGGMAGTCWARLCGIRDVEEDCVVARAHFEYRQVVQAKIPFCNGLRCWYDVLTSVKALSADRE